MLSFFSNIASRIRGSSSTNITPTSELPIAAIPSVVQNDSQSPTAVSNLSSSNNGVSAPVASPLEQYNRSPEPSREASSPVPSRTPSEPESFQIADAPWPYTPSPFHSTSSLAPSNVGSDISSRSEPSESSNQYTPSRADVITTRSIFIHNFPLEIVDIILDAAEYYPHSVFAMPVHHFDHPLTVQGGRFQAVLTTPIVDSELISRVVIRTESHDQGWSSYPQDRGTFNNSWTWLDLALDRNPTESVPTETPPDWRIYTNLHASGTWQTKEVVLDRSNEIIGALRSGDSLAIWAEARYPGWVNIVRSAKIEVVYRL